MGAGISAEPGPKSGCGLVLLSLCFFKALQNILAVLPVPSAVSATKDPFREFRWRNLLVSWIHACITGILTCICLYFYGTEMWSDLVEFRNWQTYFVTCFSAGYFVYDTLDILMVRRIWDKWEILVHHSTIISTAAYVILKVHCVGYYVMGMCIELNTIFLHLRRLLQTAAVPSTNWALLANRYCNLLTFLVFRFGPLLVLLRAIFTDGQRIPLWFLVVFILSCLTLVLVNLILFYRLLRADVWGGLSLKAISSQSALSTFRRHRKLDSMAGTCGSLEVAEDVDPQPSNGQPVRWKLE